MWRLALLPNAYNNAAARGRFASQWAMPYSLKRRATGYGGTRRRVRRRLTYNTPARRVYKRPKAGSRGSRVWGGRSRKRGFSSRTPGVPRPLRWGAQQPAQVLVKHTLVNRVTVSNTVSLFSNTIQRLLPLQGNDVFQNLGAQQRSFPNLWVNFASKYNNVRVNGMSISVTYSDLDNNGNRDFFSCFYTEAGPKDGTDPGDPYTVNSNINVIRFLQEKAIRKKRLLGSFVEKAASPVHHAGYFGVKRIQSDASLDQHVAELEVNADGTAADSPEIQPVIIHKHVSNLVGAFPATENMTATYKIVLYCQWFNRRRVFEPTFNDP